jgi:sortase A
MAARSSSTQPPADSDHDDVTLLSIPKIGLHAGILDGTDRKSLLLAPGHVKDTAWPGDSGNAVVAGHRDTFFRHLHELSAGDEIFILRSGRRFRYVVTNKMVVDPDDVGLMEPTSDIRLTLITCYPTYYIGPAPRRLVVVSRLRPESPAAGQTSTDFTHRR